MTFWKVRVLKNASAVIQLFFTRASTRMQGKDAKSDLPEIITHHLLNPISHSFPYFCNETKNSMKSSMTNNVTRRNDYPKCEIPCGLKEKIINT